MTIKDETCPRIKADARLMGDGTLWIKTDKLDKVGRVIVEHGTSCKQFYQDAQPEPHYDEWCDSCKEYDKEKHSCPRWNKVIKNTVEELKSAQPEPCEDAVSRKAVKDGFVKMCNLICPYTEKQRHAMCGSCLLGTAFDVLEATQSVTPKQGSGYWILGAQDRVNGIWAKCSACGKTSFGGGSFCRECGAKMKPYKGRSNE